MEEVKKIAKQVIEARKNMPADLDPDSPEALIHGSGSLSMGPEEMKEFLRLLQDEISGAQQAAAVAEAIPFSLFIVLASILFGFIAWVAYRLIRSAKTRELKKSQKKPTKESKKKHNKNKIL